MEVLKVCVRIPAEKKEKLMEIAREWREESGRGPGWDSKEISRIAREKYGSLLAMFEHHGWPERGDKLMPSQQKRVKETYGSVENFVKAHSDLLHVDKEILT